MTAAINGIGIAITRPRAAAEALAAELVRAGARPFVFPALAIEELPWSDRIEAVLARLPRAAWAIFVSANAVEKGLAAVARVGPWPAGLRIAAVGEATAQALHAAGFSDVLAPRERHDTEALLELVPLRAVAGRRIVIFRGEGGRERMKEGLETRGAHVEYAECYRRVRPSPDPSALLAAWARGEIDCVSALSGETLENFVAITGPAAERLAARTPLLVPHEAVARHRLAREFARVVVTGHGTPALVEALANLKAVA
jgi:uroporphyrinogen-III synthase